MSVERNGINNKCISRWQFEHARVQNQTTIPCSTKTLVKTIDIVAVAPELPFAKKNFEEFSLNRKRFDPSARKSYVSSIIILYDVDPFLNFHENTFLDMLMQSKIFVGKLD